MERHDHQVATPQAVIALLRATIIVKTPRNALFEKQSGPRVPTIGTFLTRGRGLVFVFHALFFILHGLPSSCD
jgi:hypothetical protein